MALVFLRDGLIVSGVAKLVVVIEAKGVLCCLNKVVDSWHMSCEQLCPAHTRLR